MKLSLVDLSTVIPGQTRHQTLMNSTSEILHPTEAEGTKTQRWSELKRDVPSYRPLNSNR